MTKETISLAARNIPLRHHCDVLIAGAGPAGFGAAVSAARNGASVTLVERFGMAGGLWTLGLVTPIFDSLHHNGLNRELLEKLNTRNALGGYDGIAFDPAQMALILDHFLQESQVNLMLYSQIIDVVKAGEQIRGVVVADKSGLGVITADIIIDCTGDGDVAALAGAKYVLGDANGNLQPMTMMFRVGGLRENYPKGWSSEWYEILKQRIPETEILKHVPYNCPAVVRLPRSGEAMIQWTHLHRRCGINAEDLTAATLEGRQQAKFIVDEIFPKVHDILGELYLLELPVVIGVRETRRIVGDYTLTDEDIVRETRFGDTVCRVHNSVDIHNPENEEQEIVHLPGFDIPLRALLVKDFTNLMTAGRCISGSHRAHAAYRVTGDCLRMGESAGAVAAKVLASHITLRDYSTKLLDGSLSTII